MFHPMLKYFKKIGNTESVSEWKSKGISDEVIKPPDNTFAPTVKYTGKRMYVKFTGNYFKKDKITFDHGKIVNISLFMI